MCHSLRVGAPPPGNLASFPDMGARASWGCVWPEPAGCAEGTEAKGASGWHPWLRVHAGPDTEFQCPAGSSTLPGHGDNRGLLCAPGQHSGAQTAGPVHQALLKGHCRESWGHGTPTTWIWGRTMFRGHESHCLAEPCPGLQATEWSLPSSSAHSGPAGRSSWFQASLGLPKACCPWRGCPQCPGMLAALDQHRPHGLHCSHHTQPLGLHCGKPGSGAGPTWGCSSLCLAC